MCASDARRTARLPPIITSADVAVVPMLCPTIMAQPCRNVSEPAFRATSVVAAAAVELCMTIVMMIPMPARIHCAPGPVNPSKFHETPFIPVCMYSIAVKSSPKPARIAPVDRSRPLATIHSRAPMPRMGRAAVAIRTRKPKMASSHGVEVVPSVAPMMTPIASENVTSPALTKPMTVRMAAVEDWMTAVKIAPDSTALNRPDASRWSPRRSESPAGPFRPAVRWWIPSRNRPSPPRSVTAEEAFMNDPPAGARDAERLLEGGAYARILGAFDAGVVVPVAIADYDSRRPGRANRSPRFARSEVSDADGFGQADRRAGRVRLGAPHDHGGQRLPRREATLQLVAVPVRRDLLPVLRGHPVSDLLARHVARDGLPPSGRRAGPRSGGPVARPVAGSAPGSLDRGAAADQGAGLPGRDVAAADRLPPAAGPVDLLAAPVLVGRPSLLMAAAANPTPASEATPWHA